MPTEPETKTEPTLEPKKEKSFQLGLNTGFKDGIVYQVFKCQHDKYLGDYQFEILRNCKDCFGDSANILPTDAKGNPMKLEVPEPPAEIFKRPSIAGNVAKDLLREHSPIYEIERMETPKEGGIYLYYKDMLYPRKGFVFPEAVFGVGFAKRLLISQLRFFVKNPLAVIPLLTVKRLEAFLNEYNLMAENFVATFLLERNKYMNFTKAIMIFVETFLQTIGVSKEVSETFAEIFASMFEYDDAYRYKVEDLGSCTSKEAILKNPRKESKRLITILQERTNYTSGGKVLKHFNTFVNILSVILYIPKFRKAFNKAMEAIEFKHLQLDDADWYHTALYENYNFGGEHIEVRKKKYIEMHNGKVPRQMLVNV